jgi:hypothetical protein
LKVFRKFIQRIRANCQVEEGSTYRTENSLLKGFREQSKRILILPKIKQFAWTIQGIVRKFTEAYECPGETPEGGDEGPTKVIERLSKVIERLSKVIAGPGKVIEEPDKVIEEPGKVIERLSKVIERLSKVIERLSKVIERLSKVIERPSKVIERPDKVIERPTFTYRRSGESTGLSNYDAFALISGGMNGCDG